MLPPHLLSARDQKQDKEEHFATYPFPSLFDNVETLDKFWSTPFRISNQKQTYDIALEMWDGHWTVGSWRETTWTILPDLWSFYHDLLKSPDKLDVWYQYWQKILAASGVTWKPRVGTFSDLFPLRQTPAVRRWTSGWAPLSRSSRWERTFRVTGSEWCKFRSSPTFSHFAWCSSVGLLPKAPHSSWLVRSNQTGAVETF